MWFGEWGHDGGDDRTLIAPEPEDKAPTGMAVADGGVVVSAKNDAQSWSPAYGVAGPGTTLTFDFGGTRIAGAYTSDEGGRIDFANGLSWKRASPSPPCLPPPLPSQPPPAADGERRRREVWAKRQAHILSPSK